MAMPALLLAACSPTYNWRELRPDGAALLATLPCKPDSAERDVPLIGEPVKLHMQSCTAGGQTYALAWAKLPNPDKAGEALAAWQGAALKSLQADPAQAQTWDAKVTGATISQAFKLKGKDHRGVSIDSQTVYFAAGERVYQAAVYGEKLTVQATEPFFAGLKLQQ